jgi:hypothetical protein
MSDSFRMAIVIRQPSAGPRRRLSLFEEKWPLSPRKRSQLYYSAYEEPYTIQSKIEQNIWRKSQNGRIRAELEFDVF